MTDLESKCAALLARAEAAEQEADRLRAANAELNSAVTRALVMRDNTVEELRQVRALIIDGQGHGKSAIESLRAALTVIGHE